MHGISRIFSRAKEGIAVRVGNLGTEELQLALPLWLPIMTERADRATTTFWGASYNRARYYDPNVGRFIKEDPIGFRGGLNFYSYVHNNPVLFIDPIGLNLKRSDPDPKENSPICNGKGGLDIQLGNLGTPQEKKCLEDCYRAHEASHLKDIMKYANSGTICKGIAKGVRVGFSTGQEHDASEVNAYNEEIKCLKEKQKNECPRCFQIINDAIQAAEDNRAQNQH